MATIEFMEQLDVNSVPDLDWITSNWYVVVSELKAANHFIMDKPEAGALSKYLNAKEVRENA